MRELVNKIKNLPWIKIAPYGGAVFGIILFYVVRIEIAKRIFFVVDSSFLLFYFLACPKK